MREIKFKAWFKGNEKEIAAFIAGFNLISFHDYYTKGIEPSLQRYDKTWKLSEVILLQFTGHQIKGVDLYEDDIVRLEENADGVDPSDRITYYVVTWIKEWCMFALLRLKDEYAEYESGGVDELDTASFWTFPLDVEDIGPSQYYLCGNIHSNPELLNPLK